MAPSGPRGEHAEWREHGAVLRHGAPGDWDDKPVAVDPAGVVVRNGVYYLFYTAGFDGCWTYEGSHAAVGVAISNDGVSFVKHTGNPVLVPHDFAPVSSHEEGIRTASIRFIPEIDKFLGFFSVESAGFNSCEYASRSESCECNIGLDSFIYAATSANGYDWSIEGEVSGVGNRPGHENYVDDFLFVDGKYTVWTHKAEGGDMHFASQGAHYLRFDTYLQMPELCWGWSQLTSFHQGDGLVDLLYDPAGGCAPDRNELFHATTSLDRPEVLTRERRVHGRGGERTNVIVRDEQRGEWLWYYSKSTGPDAGTIQLRTAPLVGRTPPLDIIDSRR